MAKLTIAIDAGHGSKTPGKRTAPFTKDVDVNGDGIVDVKKGEQYKEHYATVGVANLLYNKLVSKGYTVIRTGWDDSNPENDTDESLSSRQSRIRKANCECSISVHFNALGTGATFNSAKGFSVYIHNLYPEDSKTLADYVLTELSKGTSQTNRGLNSAKLAMCNCNVMKTKASILCELAFMTNEHEAMDLMANQKFWEECAEEIADGVDRYCNCSDQEKNGATTYIVKSGDTLIQISRNTLGDAGRYKEIMALNNLTSDKIYVNQVLKIPQA